MPAYRNTKVKVNTSIVRRQILKLILIEKHRINSASVIDRKLILVSINNKYYTKMSLKSLFNVLIYI